MKGNQFLKGKFFLGQEGVGIFSWLVLNQLKISAQNVRFFLSAYP